MDPTTGGGGEGYWSVLVAPAFFVLFLSGT